jgi:dipeptidyl aminopeptidase/acylaminoacyl peptidase
MRNPTPTLCRSAALALLFTLSLGARAASDAPSAAAAAPVPLASFFDNARFGGALLSPSGRYLAARTSVPGKRMMLAVIDLQTNTPTVVANYGDADIGHIAWVNDNRLAFDVTDRDVGPGDNFLGAGLYAVNRDGSNLRQLAERHAAWLREAGSLTTAKLLPWHVYLMGQDGAQDSDSIYVEDYDFDDTFHVRNVNLLSLNTVTGKSTAVPRPGHVDGWLLDAHGKPRVAYGQERDMITVYYLDPGNEQWRSLATYHAYTDADDAFSPYEFGPDGTLYVSARGGKDTRSLYAFDLKTGKIAPEPLVETKGYDFNGELVASRTRLLGVRYLTDARGTAWFDPGMKALQDKIDKLLPATVNVVQPAASADAPWVVVRSYSDVQPWVYQLYNRKTGELNRVGQSHPDIDVRRMGHQEVLRYKARDGLEIPAVLTRPAGAPKDAKLPLVVLVHGGPYMRAAIWGWGAESQFLASRGYAVLEPDYRGSTGYGARHFTAGWKQWGLAMQDDIADGTRWAIAQGIADPKRICIAGASYGGYATLMGLIRDPDLYKCGVEWVGVTDIKLMYDGQWNFRSSLPAEWKQYGMPELVGDPVKDAAQLAATSPLQQVARIHQPLLMAYGGVDRQVPIYHGQKLYEALGKTNRNVEWIEYNEEGHGWSLPKNRFDFYGKMAAFLDKNIGPGAQ